MSERPTPEAIQDAAKAVVKAAANGLLSTNSDIDAGIEARSDELFPDDEAADD